MRELLRGNDVFPFEDSLLIIPRRSPRLFLLNPTARMTWEAIAGGLTPSKVADELARGFDVPLARVRTDVAAIITEWRAHGLLAPDRGASPAMPHLAEVVAFVPPHAWRERVYQLCGAPVRVRFSGTSSERLLHPLIAHAEVAEDAIGVVDLVETGEGWLVACNGTDIERVATAEEALGQALGRILELSYPDAEWLAVMHAAAVGDQAGAVVLAGDSGSGKSTLAAGLVHAGLSYFSDDVVPLDETLRIRPMPFGISVKEGSWPVLAGRYPELASLETHERPRRRHLPVAVERHGPLTGLPVKALIFPQYVAHQQTGLRRLSRLESLQRLTTARSWMALNGRTFSLILKWIEETPAFQLCHSSLENGVDAVGRLLCSGFVETKQKSTYHLE